MADYIKELNDEQRAAVLYDEGPSLVIAGAGSGKTRVLTYKIAHLLEGRYQPWNILALTFTNKAAREMKNRIALQVGEEKARRLWMGTFHSIFLRILRAESSLLGFTSHFTIYDTADSKSLLRSILKEMGLDEKVYKPGSVQARISQAKNHLVSPSMYANSYEVQEDDMRARMPAIKNVYRRYWERCRQADAMDFDDLLFYTFLLFRDHPDVLARYQAQFGYLLVDEYQDTNFAQHSIVLQLGKAHRRVCVVGDDAQSIYSFRGADIDNILSFTSAYPGAKVFKLQQNYRSTQNIVKAANSLIAKNQRQIHKEAFSEKEAGEPLTLFQAYSDVEEGEIIANKVMEIYRHEHCTYADFAILYRTNAQSRIFEEAFRKRSLPYRIYGGLSFYQRKEVKDVIAYFRLVVNPNDEEAFKRIINYPARGIGETTVNKIVAAATEHQVSLWTVLCQPTGYGIAFNKGTLSKLQGFKELISGFLERLYHEDAFTLGQAIIQSTGILRDIVQENTPEALSRKENIEELLNGMSDFCGQRKEEGDSHTGLDDFLSEVSLLTDQDTDKDADQPKITLMTVHAAKGLEFKNVFVVGLEENLFPSAMSGDSPRAMEEERRLFYVAITRAEEHCFLSYARTRYRFGKMEFGSPSRFLKDIDARCLRLPHEERPLRSGGGRPTATFSPTPTVQEAPRRLRRITASPAPAVTTPAKRGGSPAAAVSPGQLIEHERFGVGEVIRVEGEGENAKATIHFRNAGDKQLLLRFARFKVIG
ncbi:MAG: UvrD-helicase domain-containing protein [Mediterranea sp.]|nr:UvrD-helicase domain-containing protein [Mediterranea sp.]